MNKGMRIWLILATLIVVAIFAAFWATSTFWFPRYPWEPWQPWKPHLRPPYDIRGDIELFYTVKTVISTINVTLLVFLLLIYTSIYWKTRSEFTIGLLIFTVILLIETLASSPIIMWVFGFTPFGLGPFAMLPDFFKCVALAVLLYLSVKY